jgi:hypothetical protein
MTASTLVKPRPSSTPVKPKTDGAAQTTKRRSGKQSFISDSPFVKVQKEVGQHPGIRQRLIKKLEADFGARVITYFTSFQNPNAYISDSDAEMLESLLAVEHDKGKIILILSSPGGQALAAERIVNVCRAYSDDAFEVVIPHMAKSAATMICFGASKLYMSKTAELGPVDPQVAFKDEALGGVRWISAEEYVRSYQTLFDAASDGKAKKIEPFLQQLQRYDSRTIESLRSAQSLAKAISVRLLKSGMMSELTESKIVESIQVFLSQQKTSDHGRMIAYAEAKECGLKIEPLDLHSARWNNLWELYVRSDYMVTQGKMKKLLESRYSAVHN